MPNETNETKTTGPDPRDVEITALKQQVAELSKELTEQTEHADEMEASSATTIEKLEKKVADLQEKLKAKAPVASLPSGDYCVLGGKTYYIAGTVPARFATDEGRKGHIGLDDDLVILKR